jgi:hypothetical protein
MAITAQSIIKEVADDLNDLTSIRWKIPLLCAAFNDGQRDIVTHRPDAKNTPTTIAMAAGFKQALPEGGEKLIDVLCNTTSKRAITSVDRKLLDAQVPGWRAQTGVVDIIHFLYDPREPKAFEVYPPAAAGASVEAEVSMLPTAIPITGTTYADVTGNFALGDLFKNALVNYIKYRCYSRNTEYAANPSRAMAYMQAYANDLGIELKGLLATKSAQKSKEI